MKKFLNLILGFGILFGFYFISLGIIKITKLPFPPAIIGLVLFAISLKLNIIKEFWIQSACTLILDNMALLFVPFIAGLVAYQILLKQNMLSIFLVLLIATTMTIVLTGLFVEHGVKYLRLLKMRKDHD